MSASDHAPQLSPQDADVLVRLARRTDGESSGDVARDLGLTVAETARALRRIRTALGVTSTAAALALVDQPAD